MVCAIKRSRSFAHFIILISAPAHFSKKHAADQAALLAGTCRFAGKKPQA